MTYITVTEDVEVEVEIDLRDYKDEIAKMLNRPESTELLDKICDEYRTFGAPAVIELLERKMSSVLGLTVSLRVKEGV